MEYELKIQTKIFRNPIPTYIFHRQFLRWFILTRYSTWETRYNNVTEYPRCEVKNFWKGSRVVVAVVVVAAVVIVVVAVVVVIVIVI
jgi:hypothetical protein